MSRDQRDHAVARRVLAVLLVLSGLQWVVYGSLVPILTPLIDTPVPWVSALFGVAHLVAGALVWVVHPLGRAGAVALALLGAIVATTGLVWAPGVSGAFPPAVLLGYGVPALMAWLAIRRWPSARRSGTRRDQAVRGSR